MEGLEGARIILDDDTWLAVRTTPGITGFVGMGSKPSPISAAEVKSIQKFRGGDGKNI